MQKIRRYICQVSLQINQIKFLPWKVKWSNTKWHIKYLQITKFIPNNLPSETPSWFLPTIEKILKSKIDTPVHPPLVFSLSKEAATHNMNQLKMHKDSIQKFIEAYPGSCLSPGSEFRPDSILDQLFMHHHNWPSIHSILTKGSIWPPAFHFR